MGANVNGTRIREAGGFKADSPRVERREHPGNTNESKKIPEGITAAAAFTFGMANEDWRTPGVFAHNPARPEKDINRCCVVRHRPRAGGDGFLSRSEGSLVSPPRCLPQWSGVPPRRIECPFGL